MRSVGSVVIGAFALLSASAAFAADMAVKAPVRMPVYSWTGFYVGGEIGGGWAKDTVTNVTGTAEFPAGLVHVPNRPTGVLGGIYGGYNWQLDPNWVIGLEGDFMWSGLKGDSTDIGAVAGNIAVLTDKIKWIGTATGRLGYAMNNWLFYGKAGWGWAHFDAFTNLTAPGGAAISTVTSESLRNGWTIGAGIEWALTPNWVVRAEYDFLDFRTSSFTAINVAAGGGVTQFARTAESYVNIAKVGVAYKF